MEHKHILALAQAIGHDMAATVLTGAAADRQWPGLDGLDNDILADCGIEPGTEEWDALEEATEEAYSAAIAAQAPHAFAYDESGYTEMLEAATIDEAMELAEEMLRNGDWNEQGGWAEARVLEYDGTGEEVDSRWVQVLIEPPEPPCPAEDDHEWEHLGCYGGRNGAIVSYSRCACCGLERREIDGDCNPPGCGNENGISYAKPQHWCRKCQVDGVCGCCEES